MARIRTLTLSLLALIATTVTADVVTITITQGAKSAQPTDKSPDQVAQPSKPGTSQELTDDASFRAAAINSTNFFRTQHSAPWAHWNETLATFAANYLNSLPDCAFKHSGGPYGENLAMGYQDVRGAIDAWGNERDHYDFDKGDFNEKTGHFTSMVWKESTTLGCARKACDGKGWYLICEYWPTGNILGHFQKSVGKQINGTKSDVPSQGTSHTQSLKGGHQGWHGRFRNKKVVVVGSTVVGVNMML